MSPYGIYQFVIWLQRHHMFQILDSHLIHSYNNDVKLLCMFQTLFGDETRDMESNSHLILDRGSNIYIVLLIVSSSSSSVLYSAFSDVGFPWTCFTTRWLVYGATSACEVGWTARRHESTRLLYAGPTKSGVQWEVSKREEQDDLEQSERVDHHKIRQIRPL